MSKIVYDSEIPEAVLPELRKYVDPCEVLIPEWCHQVFVGWAAIDNNGDSCAQISVHYDYRWARLTFYPCFHAQVTKQEQVIHEFAHLYVNILYNFAYDTIKGLIEDEKFRAHALEELRCRVESVTQDLTTKLKGII